MRRVRISWGTLLTFLFAVPMGAVPMGAVPMGAVPIGAQDGKKELKKELAELQGTWRVVAVATSEETRELPATEPRWVIKGDKVLYGGETLAKLKVDPTAKPRLIDLDFVAKHRLYEAIYTLTGDRLTICVGVHEDGVKERPLDFNVAGKDNRRLLVLQREKPGTEGPATPGFVGLQIANTDDGKGVRVAAVLDNGPAKKAGMKENDVILKVGATAVNEFTELVNLVRQTHAGSDVTLRVRRGEKEQDVTIRAGAVPFRLLD